MKFDPQAEYTFHNGIKRSPRGEEATIEAAKETAASNGVGKYFTLLWSDGMLTCDCRGWTVKKKGKARDCKHCKASRDSNNADLVPVDSFQVQSPVSFQELERRTGPIERRASGIRIRNRE